MSVCWYQSRLFWFGLISLVVLLAVWIGFLRTSTNLAWSNGRSQYGFALGEGKFELFSQQQPMTYGNLFRKLESMSETGFKYESIPLEPDKVEWFPPAFGSFYYGVPGKSNLARFYSVGQWVILLTLSVLWCVAMMWHQGRKRKWLAEQACSRPVIAAKIF